jgi:hypothetical protein
VENAAGSSLSAEGELPLAEVDLQRVAKVATRVCLLDVRLASFHGNADVEPGDVAQDWGQEAFIGFDSRVTEPVDHSGHLRVRCSFLCVYKAGWDRREGLPPFRENDPPAVDIEADFDLAYEVKDREGLEASDFDHFAVANGTHNAWPYWRELVQSVSQRMGLAPLVVGPFKVPSPHDPDARSN